MTLIAFVSSIPLRIALGNSQKYTFEERRCCQRLTISAKRRKGSGKQPKPKPKPKQESVQPEREYGKPHVDETFVPRGPTLRAEYERDGFIEAELGPNAGVLPEIVATRMLRRILTFGGIPLGLLFTFFAAYFLLKYKYDITVIPVVVAYSTLGTIALATGGITYGIFSSSWDEDVEGSAFGFEEAKTNFFRAKDALFGARQKEIQEDELDKIDQLNEQLATARAREEADGKTK